MAMRYAIRQVSLFLGIKLLSSVADCRGTEVPGWQNLAKFSGRGNLIQRSITK